MKKMIAIVLCAVMLLSILVACSDENEQPTITTPLLRIGILSDIHSNTSPVYSPLERFEKALRFYKEKGVDGILVTGDLLDSYSLTGMSDIEMVWQDVFPNNVNDLTGESVEPMFIYGNHDEGLIQEQIWFEEMGSEYEDAWIKEIKGYQFVGVHYTKEDETLVQKLLEQAKGKSTDKPFFFAQHVPAANTVIGGYDVYGGNEIPVQDTLQRSYNCVVFTGHTHLPITDERAIWQSSGKKDAQCTVVSCGTLHYGFLKDFSSLEINGDEHHTQQGIYMVVDGSQVNLERYSFTDMELSYEDGVVKVNTGAAKMIGKPWCFDAMDAKNRPYDYQDREEAAFAPVFPEGATIEVAELTADSAQLTVPAASVDAPEGFSDLVQSYYAQVTDPSTGEIITTAQIAAPYHVDTEPVHLNQAITINLTGLSPETEYTILVYARECYQKSSKPISIQIKTLAE